MSYKLCVSFSTRGKRINQDNFIIDSLIDLEITPCVFCGYTEFDNTQKHLFAVSDGAGGGCDGEVASKIAIRVLRNSLSELSCDEPNRVITKMLDTANEEVATYFKQDLGAATLSGLFFDGESVILFNVGDSPIYLAGKHEISQISKDHSISNTLIRYIGNRNMSGSNQAFSSSFPLKRDSVFLIASDGVKKGLTNKELFKILSKKDLNIAELITDKAHRKGVQDDITAIVIKVKKGE